MRKSPLVLVAATAALFAASASARTGDMPRLSGDANALATLVVADQHEVSVAKQAMGKGVTGPVLDFAKKMEADHGQNLSDTRRVAKENRLSVSPNADVRAMAAKGRTEEMMLAKLKGEAYSKAYVEAMVKGHTEVLAKLDTLVTSAVDPEVIAHLKATRAAVSMHLEMAKALQK